MNETWTHTDKDKVMNDNTLMHSCQSAQTPHKRSNCTVALLETASQGMSAAVGTDPSCIAQESPLLMCSLQTHLFQDSVSPRDLYSVRTAASLPPSAVLHTFQKWSQWVDLALRLWKSKRHFSCFWHEKDNEMPETGNRGIQWHVDRLRERGKS